MLCIEGCAERVGLAFSSAIYNNIVLDLRSVIGNERCQETMEEIFSEIC